MVCTPVIMGVVSWVNQLGYYSISERTPITAGMNPAALIKSAKKRAAGLIPAAVYITTLTNVTLRLSRLDVEFGPGHLAIDLAQLAANHLAWRNGVPHRGRVAIHFAVAFALGVAHLEFDLNLAIIGGSRRDIGFVANIQEPTFNFLVADATNLSDLSAT
jgi:hypothetical protein